MTSLRLFVLQGLAALLGSLFLAAAPPPASAALVGWGVDDLGQLGTDYTMGTPKWSVLPVISPDPLTEIKMVVEGDSNGYALLEDGTVWTWGGNRKGQLGDGRYGKEEFSYVPVPVCTVELENESESCPPEDYLKEVTAIAAGGPHPIALLEDGTVVTWGSDNYGQLGNGFTCEAEVNHEVLNEKAKPPCLSDIPVHVTINGNDITEVTAVAAGAGDAAVIRGASDELYTWGENHAGQLGDGTEVEKDEPQQVLENVKAVSQGGNSTTTTVTLALMNSGKVMAAGSGKRGELGNDTTENSDVPVAVTYENEEELSGVTAVATGGGHSLALLETGKVVAWGENGAGQLGNGTLEGPEHCGSGEIPCSTTPVSVCAASETECKEELEGITKIAAGHKFSLAVNGSGELFSWGNNAYGQLDNGEDTELETEGTVIPMPTQMLSEVTEISPNTSDNEPAVLALATLAPINGEPQKAALEVTPGTESVTVNWWWADEEAAAEREWKVGWRLKAKEGEESEKWTTVSHLAPSTREYHIEGLESGRQYEVKALEVGTFEHYAWEYGTRLTIATPE